MKDELSRYTLRVEQKLLDKLGYIAEYEGGRKPRAGADDKKAHPRLRAGAREITLE